MIYGSYAREEGFTPGRSDIDAVLILPDNGNVVIPKDLLGDVSRSIYSALMNNNVPF